MKILFVVGVGIAPEQRIRRWQMVSNLYAALGDAFQKLGHQIYYYVHPEALTDAIPKHLCWLDEAHVHMPTIMEKFSPDFVFCWNGSSPGDVATSTIANSYNAKMIYSEQGWFPQKDTIYFDLGGCNGKCSTKNTFYPALNDGQRKSLAVLRKKYIECIGESGRFDAEKFVVQRPDLSKPVFVPLQDERDLNIVQDSPFKTMNDFVGFLSRQYKDIKFIARPHPKYPKPELDAYHNVSIDSPRKPMFETLLGCGMVVGINSTTLQESALLGYTVMSFGESLATGTGLFYDARPDSAPNLLSDVSVSQERVESMLHHMFVKQMRRDDLGDPIQIMKSNLFSQMKGNLFWNNINR